MQPFPGLNEADFDAYLPARATSNAFVRPRLETKQKVLAVGRELAERAHVWDLALDVHASDERPSVWNKKSVTEQWVFLWRNRVERAEIDRAAGHDQRLDVSLLDPTPYYRHAFLALLLDSSCFEVGLRVHGEAWADVKNLRTRLETEAGRTRVCEALSALPADFMLGVTRAGSAGGADPTSLVVAQTVSAEQLAAMLDAAAAGPTWLCVAHTMPRSEAIATGAALGPKICEAFDALLPLYAVVAWRREDDPAAVGEEIARERAAREAQVAQAAAREAEWLAQHNAEIERRREKATSETRERVAALGPLRPGVVHAAARSAAQALAPKADKTEEKRAQSSQASRSGSAQKNPERPATGPRSAVVQPAPSALWVESDDPVKPGGRVRIQTGPFAGKVATVIELDSKGLAKVSLGQISARVESRDLVPLAEKH